MSDEVNAAFSSVVSEIRKMKEDQRKAVQERLDNIKNKYEDMVREIQAQRGTVR